jgi:hypothetical protein
MRTSLNGWISRRRGTVSAAQRLAAAQPDVVRSPSLDLVLEAKKRLGPTPREPRKKTDDALVDSVIPQGALEVEHRGALDKVRALQAEVADVTPKQRA